MKLLFFHSDLVQQTILVKYRFI